MGFLSHEKVNPYRGTVHAERVQKYLRDKQKALYDEVVGAWNMGWKNYTKRHEDQFIVFQDFDKKWKVTVINVFDTCSN